MFIYIIEYMNFNSLNNFVFQCANIKKKQNAKKTYKKQLNERRGRVATQPTYSHRHCCRLTASQYSF